MKRITSKQVISMMEAVAQVYEQSEVEQLDEVSGNPVMPSGVRDEARKRLKNKGKTDAEIDKIFADMDAAAQAKNNQTPEQRKAQVERDRLIQQAGGGAAGEKAATERLKNNPLRFLFDIEARGKADVRTKGREALRQLGDGDIEKGLKIFRAEQEKKNNTDSSSPEPSSSSSNTVPAGSFNVSPKGSDRRNEVEAQIKRDNAARTDDERVQPKPKPKPQLTDQQKVRAEYDRLRKKDPKTGKVMGSPEDLKKAAEYGMAMSKAGAANKDFSGYKSAADLAKAKSDAKSNAGPGGYQLPAGARPITKAPISTTKPAATATSTSGPGGYQLSVDARPKSNIGRVASNLANSDAKPAATPAAAVAATATNNYPGGKVGATGAAKPAATPAAKPRAQVRGREAMMAAQRNRAATPAVKAPATPAAKPAGSIADRLQQIRDMRARSQQRIAAQGGTPATPAVNPTPKATPPSTTGATTTPTVKPAAKVEKKQPLKNGDPMERMTGKGAASLMETYSKVYEEREPQAIDEGIMGALAKVGQVVAEEKTATDPGMIDEGITSVVKDPHGKAKGPSPTSKGSRTKMGPGEGGRFPEKKELPGGPRVIKDGPGPRKLDAGPAKPPYQLPKRTPENAKNVEYYKDDVDLFDVIKGHLMSEGLTEEEALQKMFTMTEEERQSIIEQQAPIHPAEAAFNKSTPEERAANTKKYGTPYRPIDTSRRSGDPTAPAWMRGGFKSRDEYNKLDQATKDLLN